MAVAVSRHAWPLHLIIAIVLLLLHMHVESREVQYAEYCEMGDMDCFELWSNEILSVIRQITGGNSVDTLSGVKKTAGDSFRVRLQAGQSRNLGLLNQN